MGLETRSAEELREAISADLIAAGISTRPYTSENLEPPCASVVPADPYFRRPTPGEDAATFGMTRVGFDVLLLTQIVEAKKTAELAGALLEEAWAALAQWRPLEARQPAEIELSESKFMGSVITIQHDTKEP